MTELTSAVREAQADADRRFGDGPVPPWEPPPLLSAGTRRRLAIVAVASVLAAALLVVIAAAKAPPNAAPAPAEPLQPERSPATDDALPVEEALPASPSAPAAAPGLALERHGAQWRLSARGAARHEVVQRLAEASGSTLHGPADEAAGAHPVHLQWQGQSLARLWPLVLGTELNFALQCRGDRCDVWILGPARPGAASIAPPLAPASFEPSAPPLPMPGSDQEGLPIRD